MPVAWTIPCVVQTTRAYHADSYEYVFKPKRRIILIRYSFVVSDAEERLSRDEETGKWKVPVI